MVQIVYRTGTNEPSPRPILATHYVDAHSAPEAYRKVVDFYYKDARVIDCYVTANEYNFVSDAPNKLERDN
jgi:hypothetical protein